MPLRLALLVVGAIVGLLARSASVASSGISFATRTPWGSIILLGVGWSLMVAAVILVPERRRTALLMYGIGGWWFVNELAIPAVGLSFVFTVALVLSASGPALVAHLALGYPTGRLRGRLDPIIVSCGYAVMVGVVGLGATTVFDPQSTGCLDCPTNLLLISGAPPETEWVDLIGLRLGAGWLLIALGTVTWRVISAGPGARGSVVPIAGCAAAFLGATGALYVASLASGALASGGQALVVWELQGASLVVLAVAACIDLRRARGARRDLTRLVVELRGAGPGGLRAALAERLGDRDLLLAYPIDSGRKYVDVDAHDVNIGQTADRTATRLVRDGVELATIVHKPGILTRAEQVDDLVASVQLALDGERLAAEDLVQLAEMRSSGVRIVAAGDAERRRIERDLHDGAQQRLVALLLALRLIRRESAPTALVAAETELRGTIADLRTLAHGVYPVLLKDAGLHAALDALAESRRLVIECDTDERCPDVVEATAYLVVAELSDAGPTSVRIGRDDSTLRVKAFVAGRPNIRIELDDRIHALGGQLDTDINEEGTCVTLTLPTSADQDSDLGTSQSEH